MNMERKRKLYGTLIGVTIFIVLMVGATLAYFSWTSASDNTNVNLTVTKSLESLIVYKQGTSILGTDNRTLEVSQDYTGGISATIEFWKKENVTKSIYGQISLEILNMLSATDTTDANIAKTDTVKWAITTYNVNDSNEVLLNEGTFNGRAIGDKWEIATDIALNNFQTFFKVYLWIDAAEINRDLSIEGELISTEISASATDTRFFYTESAAYKILTLANDESNANACDANQSGICPTNPYTTETGETAYHEYRYRGAEVNNYVSFNNDLYRIIGVFDDYTHGVEGQYLVKLISANLLSANSWGNYTTVANQNNGTYEGCYNDWIGNRGTEATTDDASPANLNLLLNQYFYNKTNGLSTDTYGICQNWTFYYDSTDYRANDCSDIVGYGIGADVRDYIENVTWHLKGKTSNEFSKQDFYTCERSGDTTVASCSSGKGGTYAKSTTGKIGLMYVSDYMYASGYFVSSSTQSGSSGYHGNQNWLYKGYEWTITPDGDSASYAFYVTYFGDLNSNFADSGRGVRPSFYLKSTVLIDGGEGTIDNPFTLSM